MGVIALREEKIKTSIKLFRVINPARFPPTPATPNYVTDCHTSTKDQSMATSITTLSCVGTGLKGKMVPTVPNMFMEK